jgi:enamine deaminase RidA (YjgF/YER057c/UK114 family)
MGNQYIILKPHRAGTILSEIDDLNVQIMRLNMSGRIFLAKFFLSDATNQWPLLLNHAICDALEGSVFTYIEQPPLDGHHVNLLIGYAQRGLQIVYRKYDNATVAYREDGHVASHIFQSVRFTADECAGADAYRQTVMAFERHTDLLKSLGLTLKDHCIRTWLYVRDIDVNYAAVVRARNDVFAREGLTFDTHFIASTGIGGSTAVPSALVAVDFYSAEDVVPQQVRYLKAPEYLNATHEYGVAFERGTCLYGKRFIISGTASIDKEGHCIHLGDVAAQTDRLLTNIDMLMRDGGGTLSDVKYFIVYLRDVADAKSVAGYMKRRFPLTPFIIAEARVCRPAWLIEMECHGEK